MERIYFDKFYDYEREHWYFLVRKRILKNTLKRFLKNQPTSKVLNIGVATGATSEMLNNFGEVTSVEFDKTCAEFTSKVLNKPVYNNSITSLPFPDESFDVVCAFDVLEHVDDHVLGVTEMQRVCKPNGMVYITVPAFMSLWSEHDIINHHKRRYRLSEIRDMLKVYNGKELFYSYFNSLLFIPIYLVRQFHKYFKKENKSKTLSSDLEVVNNDTLVGKALNFVLGNLFSLEVFLLKFLRFPAGVSVIYLWKKNKAIVNLKEN